MKKFIFIIGLLIVSLIIFPASVSAWTMQIDGEWEDDDALGIAVDSGEIFVTGYKSARDPMNRRYVYYRPFIAKFTDSLNGPILEWEQDLKETLSHIRNLFPQGYGRDIVIAEDKVYVIGRYYNNNGWHNDIFIVALNRSDGSIEWHTSMNVLGFDNFPGGIVVDFRDKNISIYATGYCYSESQRSSVYPYADSKIFAAKYILPNNTPEWVEVFESTFNPPASSSGYEAGNDLVIGNDGFLYVIGTVSSIINNPDGYSYTDNHLRWLAKISRADGSLIWEKTGESLTSGHDITLDSEGFIWTIGQASPYGSFLNGILLEKYDSDGNVLSSEGYDTSNSSVADRLVGKQYGIVGLPRDGGVAWTGYEGLEAENYNIITHTPLWEYLFDGQVHGHDFGRAIAVDNEGYIYVAGRLRMEYPETKPEYVSARYGYDIFLCKYPNPAVGPSIRIRNVPDMTVNEGEEVSFRIVVENPGDRSFTFSVSGLPVISTENILNPHTGEFRWTPGITDGDSANGRLEYPVAFSVTDGIETAGLLVYITVADVKPNLTITRVYPRMEVKYIKVPFFRYFRYIPVIHQWATLLIANNGERDLSAAEDFSVAYNYKYGRYFAVKRINHNGIRTGRTITVDIDINWYLNPLRFRVDSNNDVNETNESDNEYR